MIKQEDLQAEMLISAEAKRFSDRYNKDYLNYEDLMKITGFGKRKVVSVMASVRWAYFRDDRRKN